MTALETILWSELKGRHLDGYKFRRQAPIGQYVVDFYCPAAKLIVEIDGPHHDRQEAADEKRTLFFEARGRRVIRFRADNDRLRIEEVLAAISQECRVNNPPHLSGEGRVGDVRLT